MALPDFKNFKTPQAVKKQKKQAAVQLAEQARHPTNGQFVKQSTSFHMVNNPNGSRPTQ